MDSKTKAEYRKTPGWHSIDERMQTNAEHRNLLLSVQKQSQRAVTDVILCSALVSSGLFSMILIHMIKEVINVPN